MKYFGGKKGTNLLIILVLLLIFVIGISVYFSIPVREGAVGTSSISSVQDVLSIPGVAKGSVPPSNSDNWAMVNEITEPDGTIVQDIVNTDGTVLTITNKQNVINTGNTVPPTPTTNANVNVNTNATLVPNNMTFNRNTF